MRLNLSWASKSIHTHTHTHTFKQQNAMKSIDDSAFIFLLRILFVLFSTFLFHFECYFTFWSFYYIFCIILLCRWETKTRWVLPIFFSCYPEIVVLILQWEKLSIVGTSKPLVYYSTLMNDWSAGEYQTRENDGKGQRRKKKSFLSMWCDLFENCRFQTSQIIFIA